MKEDNQPIPFETWYKVSTHNGYAFEPVKVTEVSNDMYEIRLINTDYDPPHFTVERREGKSVKYFSSKEYAKEYLLEYWGARVDKAKSDLKRAKAIYKKVDLK